CGANPATGDRQWLEARRAALPEPLRARYTVVPYVGSELAGIYAATTLVVARAGAGTVNECCQLGLPVLYIPLPGTSGDEQTLNARLVERAGGAVVLPQAELSPERLLAELRALLGAPRRGSGDRSAADSPRSVAPSGSGSCPHGRGAREIR